MNRRDAFELFVSQTVIEESAAGDSDAARRRLEVLKQFPLLDVDEEVKTLAADLIAGIPLPRRAEVDALHIAVAAANGRKASNDSQRLDHRARFQRAPPDVLLSFVRLSKR